MRWQYLLSSVASLTIIGAAATTAHAQEKPKPTATSKQATKPATTAAKKAEARTDKAERAALDMAESDPGKVLKGIKLTKAEQTQINTIKKKYRDQVRDLRKTHEAAEKAGTENDSQIAANVQAIVDQENAELRAALTPAQQATFDKNLAKIKK